jgi:hypothetical protein
MVGHLPVAFFMPLPLILPIFSVVPTTVNNNARDSGRFFYALPSGVSAINAGRAEGLMTSFKSMLINGLL